jgi:hypothetical protein
MKHRTLVLLLTSLTAAVSPIKYAPAADAPNFVVPFELNGQFGSILIQAQVNGRAGLLLVDTGCSHTVLSPAIVGVNPLFSPRASAPVKGSALTGVAAWARATIEIGTLKWSDRRVLVTDGFDEISKNMKQKVDGLVGEDLLKEFTCVVIDFRNRRLVLQR